MQAAYFFNFIKYTNWPDSTTQTLVVKVLQDGVVAAAMKDVPEKVIHDRSLVVFNCMTATELEGADAVFIPEDAARRLPDSAWGGFGPTVLVVSDWDEALNHGATIQLNSLEGKIRFAINLECEKKIRISSKLLRLATEIRK